MDNPGATIQSRLPRYAGTYVKETRALTLFNTYQDPLRPDEKDSHHIRFCYSLPLLVHRRLPVVLQPISPI